MSSGEWDNYAINVYFNQVVDRPPINHPIPDDWSIFISIASYRDMQLIHTIRSLVKDAVHPERLRIVVFNQWNYLEEYDKDLNADLNKYIEEAA